MSEKINNLQFVVENMEIVKIFIDGKNLIELTKIDEVFFDPKLAGKYGWLHKNELLDGINSVLNKNDHEENKVTLIGCDCGESGCWPLEANLEINTDTVIFKNFQQPYRKDWTYKSLDPLIFTKTNFFSELEKLKSHKE